MPARPLHREARLLPDTALVVPTINGGSVFEAWLQALDAQLARPAEVLVIDSSSTDGTAARARAAGLRVHVIPRRDFDHGGTRQLAVDMLPGARLIAFMTQDALLANEHALERLLDVFADPSVGAAYGRQLPRPGANAIEAHARLFNYGATTQRKTPADVARLGIKAAFLSDSFSAFRREALLQVGGFPRRLILGEDEWAAAKLLAAGWDVVYCAEAEAIHSHSYNALQQFRRYFDIGVFHSRAAWIRGMVGRADGEGFKFLKSELGFLARSAPALIPAAFVHNAAKLAGYKLGLIEALLPRAAKPRLSMSPRFWEDA